jgi:Xaa-Pro aminopeptidase
MAQTASQYEGDESLLARLNQAGATLDMDQWRAIADGVVAAPESREADAWMALLAPNADEPLKVQLRLFRELTAERYDPGFTVGPAPRERIGIFRDELEKHGLNGFIVPRTDEHQGEYVPAYAERLRWLTGFSGSAGVVVVLAEKAAIFVDGRYTLQVLDQVHGDLVEPIGIADMSPTKWLSDNLPAGAKIGYDPWLLTESAVASYRKSVDGAGGSLVAVTDNPVDEVWTTQPAAPLAPVVPHDLSYAGQSAAEKRQIIAGLLSDDGIDAALLTLPDSIAWLLNIRGGDVAHTPLPLSFGIVMKSGDVDLFIDPRKLIPGTVKHLGNGVSVRSIEEFSGALEALAKAGAVVKADPGSAAALVFEKLDGATIVRDVDPCVMPKACKNSTEIDGARAAHRRDGRALTQFLAWFASEAPKGELTELEAADRLAAYRFKDELIRDLSFGTISGAGPNGAIVHYSVNEETNRKIEPGQLFLVDSGAQYLDGTTDVTRTIAVGAPLAEMRDRFTRVLKGHIALAMARFPEGTTGAQLDTLARMPLWQAGLDFDHGTGHGVGSYLGVHEGPHGISKRNNTVTLKPGMIVSNEPGYYKTDAYGIRIENLVTVVRSDELDGAERPTLALETLTLAPIDLNLVEPSLLAADELEWLNAYHIRVRETHIGEVDEETVNWLEQATRPLEV